MFKKLLALLIIALSAYASIHLQMPEDDFINNPTANQFSNKRAFQHVQQLAKKPHAVATKAHDVAMQYCIDELEKMGLDVHTQEGNSFSNWGTFAKVKNIVARLKGSENSKALLVMSHYDSAGSSSYGASDAGSGVATILEGIRSFMARNQQHKNDIIILLTDGEELGLNGANLFVNQHPWAKNIGLVLNFEARGSGGPSFTLVETNKGNAKLIQEFIKANPQFPVANSLAYSIYKKMPNDTDLTVFRQKANIPGFNFAFIDDHFDYHSALDIPERLNNNSLSHQASYLIPLLTYFSNANLSQLNTTDNWVYFNSPLGMLTYPYSYILPLVLIACLVFFVIFIYGKKKQQLNNKEIGKGFLAFLSALVINGSIGFWGWKLLQILYPPYNEILQGFPYNGHTYILFFVFLSLAVSFYIYKQVYTQTNTKELLVAPIVIWLLLHFLIAFKLKGASFLIIPTFFMLGLWWIHIKKEKPSIPATTLLCLPALFIISPFVQQFPIALGLKMIASSTVLVTLLFGLLLPVFGHIRRKRLLSRLLLLIATTCFISAHFTHPFTAETPKPNSLVYLQDNDTQQSYWLSYDNELDTWNASFFKNETTVKAPTFNSKYLTRFKHIAKATPIALAPSKIHRSIDTVINQKRNIRFCITPQSDVNSIIIQSENKNAILKMSINGTPIQLNQNSKFTRNNKKQLAQYYVVDKEAMEIDLWFNADKHPKLTLYNISHRLLGTNLLSVPKRNSNMIPKPFVINDAIIVTQQLNFDAKN